MPGISNERKRKIEQLKAATNKRYCNKNAKEKSEVLAPIDVNVVRGESSVSDGGTAITGEAAVVRPGGGGTDNNNTTHTHGKAFKPRRIGL